MLVPFVRSRVSSGLLLVAAVPLLWSADAEACKRRSPGPYVLTEQVPVDGALLFEWQCTGVCTQEQVGLDVLVVDIDLENTLRVPLAGSLVRRGVSDYGVGWAAWRPAVPLESGHHYGLSTSARPELQTTFVAITRVGFDPRSLDVRARVEVVEREAGEQVCCTGRPRDSCGREPCFQPRREERVWLSLEADGSAGRQWLYRASFQAEGHEPVVRAAQPRVPSSVDLAVAASTYCYKLEAEHVIDGTVVTVSEACPGAAQSELKTRALRDDELEAALQFCDSAPPGYEDAFRDQRASAPTDSRVNESGQDADTDRVKRGDAAEGCALARGPSPWRGLGSAMPLLLGLAAIQYSRRLPRRRR